MWWVLIKSGSNCARRHALPPTAEGAERIAVIALAPGDDMAALRLADLDKILARHLERRLDRLRTAAHQIDAARDPAGASSIRRSARRSAASVVKKAVCA